MTNHPIAWIFAFKPIEAGLGSCDLSDEAATIFEVHHRGAMYTSSSIRVSSRLQAEQIAGALRKTHEIGMNDQMANVRAFFGIR